MISCTSKDKPLALPWRRTSRLDSDVRVRTYVIRVTADFNAQDYATLVAHPSPFQKFPKAFLCLVGLSRHYTLDEETYPWFVHKDGEDMDLFTFIHGPDPTKVRVVEQERDEGEPQLLKTIVGRTVPLLPIAPDRAESELEARVDRLFNEGGSGHQTEGLREGSLSLQTPLIILVLMLRRLKLILLSGLPM
uniref:Transposase (Putative), gypsy type n=1 Tax=Tanacetum cinerariifolium TaxID=118510 RepID=A0A699IE27_TANCI|nr:transposase (putative), gypsy type [Tanacetum cinerariifolium]